MTEDIESYSQMQKEFCEKYASEIVPFVQKQEDTRKLKLVLAIISSSILAILGSLVLFVSIKYLYDKSNPKSIEGTLKLSVVLYGLAYVAWLSIKKHFENNIKSKIMPTVCSCFNNLKWSCDVYSGSKIFLDSCVVPKFTSESYDDIFTGSYKDVSIDIVEAKYDIGSGKNKNTVFDGVIVKLNMNKSFKSHTIIKPNTLINKSPSPELHHIELEDVQFNRKFDVYTNDDVDSRYLITPTFMERLKNIKIAFKANDVNCAFSENFLIIALSTNEDLFSLCSLIKRMDDDRQYFKMFEEILSIIKLIDHFKLNQKIGL